MQRKERLREHRIRRNWRQQDVADQLGVSLITIQRWERGYQQPSNYYQIKLCKLFGVASPIELGLGEMEPLDERSVEEHTALWTVPHARNPHFTGREEILTQLLKLFAVRETTPQLHVLKGIEGAGKTQIALEYAYRALEQKRYLHTIWLQVASEAMLLDQFTALTDAIPGLSKGQEVRKHKQMAAIINWLEQCKEPWLLILDSVNDLSFLPIYLPTRGKGSILITTRTNSVGSLTSSTEVECMELLEATQFLLRRSQQERSVSADKINTAIAIVNVLKRSPLAIDHAGAYIEETGCSLYDYLQIYQQHGYTLLARRGQQVVQWATF